MRLFLFNPTSIGLFALLALCLVITIYLFHASQNVGDERTRRTSLLLAGTITALAVLVFLMLLEVSFFHTWNVIALYLESFFLAIILLFMLQFAYEYPANVPQQKTERLIFLYLSAGYAVFELILAVQRYISYSAGHFMFRPVYADYPAIASVLWLLVVFFRRSVRASRQFSQAGWFTHLFRPQGRAAKSTRSFLGLILIGLVLVVFDHFAPTSNLSESLFRGVLFFGLLLLISAFTTVYLNYFPELVDLRERLIGVGLMTNLVVLSISAWVMQYPTLSPDLDQHLDLSGNSLQYSANAQGGYDLSMAENTATLQKGSQLEADFSVITLPFEFEFYGQGYDEIYIFRDGIISLGERAISADFRNRYGSVPAIFGLYYPSENIYSDSAALSDSGVFYSFKPDQVVVTWQHMPEAADPEAEHSFQVVLHSGGDFEINYFDVQPDARRIINLPQYLVWFTGATPGNQAGSPMLVENPSGLPVSGSGRDGLFLDLKYRVLEHQDHFMATYVPLMFLSSLAVIIFFPINLEKSVLLPVRELISGVEKVKQGDYSVITASEFDDELGQIMNTFNAMVSDLDVLSGHRTPGASTFSQIFEHSPSAVMVVDQGFHIEYVNRMFGEMTGFTSEEVVGNTPNILTSGKTLMDVYRKLWHTILSGDVWRGEILNKRKSGDEYWVFVVVAPIKDQEGKNNHYIWMMEDFTERKQAEEALIQLSITDSLTGIYNRRQIFVLGQNAVEQARRYGSQLSVLMLDVDHFKHINDTYGHAVGDQTLVMLAETLKRNVRAADVVGRYGGEEFVVIMPNTSLEGATVAAEHLRETLSEMELSAEGQQVRITVSIGVCDLQPGDEAFEQAVNGADMALYSAKQAGRNQVMVCSEEDEMPWELAEA